MAGKAINQYNTFSGSASDVNVLVQETSQTDPNTYEHKKAKLDTIIATMKNIANGLAGLDGNGLIPDSLLPAKYDDVVEGYYYNGVFYTTSAHTTAMTATTGRIYIDLGGTGNLYRYTGSAYVQITDNDLRGDVEEDVAEIEADLANTNNRVTSNSQRIANIEDKSEPFTIEYPSADYGKGTVPASIEKSGMSVKVKGKTRAIAQIYDISNQLEIDSSGIVLTVGTTYLTINGTASSAIYRQTPSTFKFVSGHKYMFIMSGWSETKCYLTDQSGLNVFGSGTRVHQNIILTAVASGGDLRITIPSGSAFTNVKMTLNCYDLTFTFGAGNEPTSVTDALKALQDLGKYTPYGYSLPSTIVSGMKAISPNIWDEEWELGGINANGEEVTTSSSIRCKNYTLVEPSTEYFINNSKWPNICAYDANKSFVGNCQYSSETGGYKITTPQNCRYVRWGYNADYGTVYNHDVQFCLNSYPQKTVYHPYSSDSITFSEPVTLRSAGSVEDELIPESGKVTRPVDEVDMGDINWAYDSTYQFFYYLMHERAGGLNFVCSHYNNIGAKTDPQMASVENMSIASNSVTGKYILLKNTSKTGSDLVSGHASWLEGVKLAFEKATPTTETLSPSPTALSVEPYGEVSLIQDQDIKLDGSFSMRYIPDSPYVKKADIVDNLNSSDVSKPLSANMGRVIGATLDQHDSRIKNLEQKAGDYSIVQYRGTNAVPTGKAKYGLVKSIVGKSRAWNSLGKAQTSGSAITRINDYSVSVSFDSSFTGYPQINEPIQTVNGHKYLVYYKQTSGTNMRTAADGIFKFFDASTIEAGKAYIADGDGTTDILQLTPYTAGVGGSGTFYFIVRDLTLILSDWSASDITTANIPLMVQQVPDLLKYDAYNTSLVDETLSGVKSVGVNICDEDWEVGRYDVVIDGEAISDPTRIRSANYIEVSEGQTYYALLPCTYLEYDANKNYITGVYLANGGQFTLNQTTRYIRYYLTATYGIVYHNDFQICLNSYSDKTTYHPYKTHTLALPETVTLRSAGSVADEYYPETGEVTHPIRSYTFTGNETWQAEGTSGTEFRMLFAGLASIIKPVADNSQVGNIVLDGYVAEANALNYYKGIGVSVTTIGNVYVYDPSYNTASSASAFASYMTGKTIYFELATPDPDTYVDPIPNPFIQVEGGGTIDTIQDQTPVIDNCLDVGYLAV